MGVILEALALVGNPRAGSRTATVALHVLRTARPGATAVLDLAELGPAVLDPASEPADQAVARVRAAELLVVASPTYKASYTGLLKAFLDRLPTGGLQGVVVLPLMVGASPGHAGAVQAHLVPLLLELGAELPVGGLYLQESQLPLLGSVDDPVREWLAPLDLVTVA